MLWHGRRARKPELTGDGDGSVLHPCRAVMSKIAFNFRACSYIFPFIDASNRITLSSNSPATTSHGFKYLKKVHETSANEFQTYGCDCKRSTTWKYSVTRPSHCRQIQQQKHPLNLKHATLYDYVQHAISRVILVPVSVSGLLIFLLFSATASISRFSANNSSGKEGNGGVSPPVFSPTNSSCRFFLLMLK